MQKKKKEETEHDLHRMLENLWNKIDEKFPKISLAFRFFDLNQVRPLLRSEC